MNRYVETNRCPKCKGVAKTEHQEGPSPLITPNGVMKRTCVRCGHVWRELPLDAATDEEAQRRIRGAGG